MKELQGGLRGPLAMRLEHWRADPHPIHRFVRVNFSHDDMTIRRGAVAEGALPPTAGSGNFDVGDRFIATDGRMWLWDGDRYVFLGSSPHAPWWVYTDFPRSIEVDGYAYSRDNRLFSVGDTTLSSGQGKSSFTFQVIDDDGFVERTAQSGIYRGFEVRCDIHFAGTEAEIKSLDYRDVYYAGVLDGIAIARLESGKFVATLTCASPFAALDEMRGRMGSKEDQRALNDNDPSMDEAVKPVNEADLKWGQSI